jgi:hypothetical protein
MKSRAFLDYGIAMQHSIRPMEINSSAEKVRSQNYKLHSSLENLV